MNILSAMIRLIKAKYARFQCHKNPVRYARSIGIQIGKGTRFYGAQPKMFSLEPWVIKIGDNCHITDDVLFETHDTGTLTVE